MSSPPRFTIQVRVGYADCDPMGVAHHSVYPRWLEQAHTELLRAAGQTYGAMEEAGYFLVVARMEIRYLKPARYDQVLEVTATLARAQGVRVEHDYTIRSEGLVVASALTVLACVGRDGRPRALPQGLFPA